MSDKEEQKESEMTSTENGLEIFFEVDMSELKDISYQSLFSMYEAKIHQIQEEFNSGIEEWHSIRQPIKSEIIRLTQKNKQSILMLRNQLDEACSRTLNK